MEFAHVPLHLAASQRGRQSSLVTGYLVFLARGTEPDGFKDSAAGWLRKISYKIAGSQWDLRIQKPFLEG